ncbi:hypothetical protein AVEN_124895-1 [Araneus ventricosus]|uniref:Uncharacterized protein n=1 Tax=Araneus ventricosus TaxID=182803 RepID=A0A4Y2FYD2_ARAVE|nr:hypothetical protein AVEN_124895-1 [Araneus ventricosus]
MQKVRIRKETKEERKVLFNLVKFMPCVEATRKLFRDGLLTFELCSDSKHDTLVDISLSELPHHTNEKVSDLSCIKPAYSLLWRSSVELSLVQEKLLLRCRNSAIRP